MSQAGDQRGLNDARTMLVKEAFRVYDGLPRRCAAQSIHQSVEL